jgi:hypothetical protein
MAVDLVSMSFMSITNAAPGSSTLAAWARGVATMVAGHGRIRSPADEEARMIRRRVVLGLFLLSQAGCPSRKATGVPADLSDGVRPANDQSAPVKDRAARDGLARAPSLDDIIRACALAVSCSAGESPTINDCLRAFDLGGDWLQRC